MAAGNPEAIDYLLGQVGGEELLGLPRQPSVLRAVLTRHGVGAEARADAARELAERRGTRPAAELVDAVRAVDAAQGGHAAHVLHGLGEVLMPWVGREGGPSRESLAALAEEGRLPATRALGYAALVTHDGGAQRAWDSASQSRSGLLALLEGVPRIPDADLRAGLHGRLRPLLFAPPAALADGLPRAGGGTGLAVRFYEPAPPNARRETLAGITPAATLKTANVTLDLEPARRSDSFGVAFEGTLYAPEAGRYTFTTRSDDGSRLYLGERCVVDNDGDHGMRARSGSIELVAGPHPFLVTFYEQGGGEGLEVSWEGPGFGAEPIPDHALGSRGAGVLRAAAVRAMAHVPGHEDQKFADATRVLGDDGLLEPAVELLRSVPPGRRPAGRIRDLVDTLAAHVSGLGAESRTAPPVVAALELGCELASALPPGEAEAARERLDGLGGSIVLIRTLPHQMLYDLSEFWVEAGRPVSIVFQNNDVMPHNLVITVPGAMAEVGLAAERLSGQPGAEERQFVPAGDRVLWHTRLLFPGESERLTFVAPETPGEHPFVCTYPGHWRVMNGVMHVVSELGGEPRVARRTTDEAPAPAREFVRDWTLDELAPRLAPGWERGRSPERGRTLFTEAGCVKCHLKEGEGAAGGPELTAIRDKYRGVDLLRHVLEPSLEILPEYAFHVFELDDGTDVVGRVASEDADRVDVVTALLEPDAVTVVPREAIVDRWDTKVSPMPNGLLVTLDEDEILDLLCYLQDPGEAPEDPGDPGDELWVTYEGAEGAGRGKHVVLIAGDEEYRSEEALPMLARILAEHHGFRATVLFSTDPETGEIDPDEQTHIPGMHLLDDADLVVCFLRFRELPDDDMAHFVHHVESGKPVVGIRTATHAFDYKRDKESPYRRYHWRSDEWPGGFGRQILGDTWISHHGRHGSESTRGVVAEGAEDHPVLRGVDDIWGPTDVYGIRHLDQDEATVLLRGQVLAGMEPTSPPVEGPKNEPMMPLVWLRELERGPGEPAQRVVCSTIGASVDFESEGLRRVFVNACYWAVGLEASIPEESRVDYVGDYEPTFFGFGKYRKGMRAADFVLD